MVLCAMQTLRKLPTRSCATRAEKEDGAVLRARARARGVPYKNAERSGIVAIALSLFLT